MEKYIYLYIQCSDKNHSWKEHNYSNTRGSGSKETEKERKEEQEGEMVRVEWRLDSSIGEIRIHVKEDQPWKSILHRVYDI